MLWLSVLALIGMHGAPDYRRHKLHELVATADQIVVGTIDAVQDTTFDLTVERTLAGEDRPKLHLRRFIDWMCASRYAPYSTGRRVLLFVVDGRAIGGGNEGDWPLVGEGVLVPYSVRGSRYVEREVHGGRLGASWVPLADVVSALPAYRRVFESTQEETRCRSAADLEDFSRQSSFARELVEDALRCPCFRGPGPEEEPEPRGILSARRLHLDPTLDWIQDDGAEFPSRLALALLASRSARSIEVTASPAYGPRLVRFTRAADGSGSEVRRLEAADLGLAKDSLFDTHSIRALVKLDDRNGDGSPELAFSRTRFPSHRGKPHLGTLTLFSWTAAKGEVLRTFTAENLPEGLMDSCLFGQALCTPGDLDGDGRAELVLSRSPDPDWLEKESDPKAASLAVLFLDAKLDVARWSTIGAAAAGSAGPSFGAVLAGPGDINGDGVPDLVVGEPLDEGDGPDRGAVRVLFLDPKGELHSWKRVEADTPALAATLGLEDGDEFGACLAGPGDLDGDGVPDLVVGGARALWTLCFTRDGFLRSARRQPLEAIFPEGIQPVSVTPLERDEQGPGLLLAATFGTGKPRDVGMLPLRYGRDGWMRE